MRIMDNMEHSSEELTLLMTLNDIPVGRNVDEYLRQNLRIFIKIDRGIYYTDMHDEVGQESWKPGDEGIKVSKQRLTRQ
ncbi:unnamed protein product [Paramecium octaurelia]|uniref:Uncharacterized protein n=1 Tax=Paramecium octaurelia TaxID=43137 RepID=A0A8S1X8F6_PAROT|nr:unnamed protein product [Paramecium octaurelia]